MKKNRENPAKLSFLKQPPSVPPCQGGSQKSREIFISPKNPRWFARFFQNFHKIRRCGHL